MTSHFILGGTNSVFLELYDYNVLDPGWGHCVVFLGKTFSSHSASLHASVYKWANVQQIFKFK